MPIVNESDDYKEWEVSVVDVETDDLKYTKIHCLVVRDVITLNHKTFVNTTEAAVAGVPLEPDWLPIEKFPKWTKDNGVKYYVAHNGICFDMCVIKDLLDFEIPLEQTIDTLVISKLFMPQREGGHSIDAWGIKLGLEKSKHDDFKNFSKALVDRCVSDTMINLKVLKHLQKEQELWKFSDLSVRLEHRVREIIYKQEKDGFFLDRVKATHLLSDTATKMAEVEKEMYKVFVPQPRIEKEMVAKFRKDGKLSKVGQKAAYDALEEMGLNPEEYILGQKLVYITLEDFNLGSPKQVAERLVEIGWKPKNLTPTGLPKIDEESLAPFAKEFPQVGLLSEFLMLRSRNSLAEQWLEAVDSKGYVHGRVDTMGAITGRMTHSGPNMSNVPAASDAVPYGKECRDCWTVEDKENYRLVGCDASSLELRMLCHYMDDPEYTDAAVSGDIHALNMKAFKFCDDPVQLKKDDPKTFKELRDISKTALYALLYGAGDKKAGSIVGGGVKKGKELKQNLFTGIPKFGDLVKWVTEQANNGYVYGLDGRRIWTRSSHAALNTLLQGGGAIVCKAWMCFISKMAKDAGLDFKQVCQIHDELQFSVKKEHVEQFKEITKLAMKETEKFLGMKCPLDSEAKEGLSWKETH